MKTILIPVDFSDTSANALRYAANFVKDVSTDRIILLTTHYVSLFAELLPSADFVQVNADDMANERQKIEKRLRFIAQKLMKKCNCPVKVETAISDLPLLRALHQLMAQEAPYLLLVGSDSASENHSSAVGELVIDIAKTSTVPVMVVPSNAKYQSINRALVACDFTNVSRLVLLKELRNTYSWLKPQLLILNIDHRREHEQHEEEHAAILKEILENYAYKVYYTEDEDIVQGVISLARQQNVQLIIALPGRYSFFRNLTHRSITHALALNSANPVLILK